LGLVFLLGSDTGLGTGHLPVLNRAQKTPIFCKVV